MINMLELIGETMISSGLQLPWERLEEIPGLSILGVHYKILEEGVST